MSAVSKSCVGVMRIWDPSAMNPEDPEQRIRDLERGVSQPPEAAPPQPFPPPPQPFPSPSQPYGTPFSGPGGGPYMGGPYGGGFGAFGVSRGFRNWSMARMLMSLVIPLVAVLVPLYFVFSHNNFGLNPFHTGTITVPSGGVLTVGGSGESKTVACNGSDLTLGGDNMTFTVTGHCRRIEVAGDDNHVTVDSADVINADGDDNATIYHSGSPTINNSGSNNTVSRG
jgi:hypothetical protein